LPDAATTVVDSINLLLERRGVAGFEVTPESKLSQDLSMDSLEIAELSAMLEDTLGTDPYTEGLLPETVGEIVAFYN
jgi:acyl carrier protein